MKGQGLRGACIVDTKDVHSTQRPAPSYKLAQRAPRREHKTHWNALQKTTAVPYPTHQAIGAGLPALAPNSPMSHKTMRRQILIDRRPAQIRSGYPGRVMEAATPEAAQGPAYNERGGGPHLDWQCKEQLLRLLWLVP